LSGCDRHASARRRYSLQTLPGVPLRHLFTHGRGFGIVRPRLRFFLDYGIPNIPSMPGRGPIEILGLAIPLGMASRVP
jgi:hypothetical protein